MPDRRHAIRIAILAAAGIGVVLMAGGVSVSRWVWRGAPGSADAPLARPPASPEDTVGGLLGAARPVSVYRDGRRIGVGLRGLAPDGLAAGLGLREGDLVRSINGIAADSEGLAGELFSSLLASPRVELEVERRDGREERIAVPRQEMLGALEALGAGDESGGGN